MHIFQKKRILLTCIIILLALPASHAETLGEAIAARRASVKIASLGHLSGDALVAEVSNNSSGNADWSLEPGQLAEPDNALAPRMVIRRVKGRRVDAERYEPLESIQLQRGEKGQFVLEAYSTEIRKPEPAKGTAYLLSQVRPDLAQVFSDATRLGVSGQVVQTAIWILTTDEPMEDLQKAIPVAEKDFHTASDLAQRARPLLPGKSGVAAQAIAPLPQLTPPPAPVSYTPLVMLRADGLTIGQTGKNRSATLRLGYEWQVAPDQRPSNYTVCLRFESAKLTSAVVPGRMEFDGNDGMYQSVVEQGVLEGKGTLVYAVFRDIPETISPVVLTQMFDNLGKEPQSALMSNVLKVPIDWGSKAESALDVALEVISTSPTLSNKAGAPEAHLLFTDKYSAKGNATPAAMMTPTPQPTPQTEMDRVLPQAVAINLPLKNGGVLTGHLIGCRAGKLVLRGQKVEFEFDPRTIGADPNDILNQAQAQLAARHPDLAMQLAVIGGMFLADPAPAVAIIQQAQAQAR